MPAAAVGGWRISPAAVAAVGRRTPTAAHLFYVAVAAVGPMLGAGWLLTRGRWRLLGKGGRQPRNCAWLFAAVVRRFWGRGVTGTSVEQMGGEPPAFDGTDGTRIELGSSSLFVVEQ